MYVDLLISLQAYSALEHETLGYAFYVGILFLVLAVLGCVGSVHSGLKGPLLCTALFHHRVHYI